MNTVIEWALSLVFTPLVDTATIRLQGNILWIEKMFQMNKIERLTTESNSALGFLLTQPDRIRHAARSSSIATWEEVALESDLHQVQNHTTLVKQVAANIAAFKYVCSADITVTNADNDSAIRGSAAFERKPEKHL